MQRGSVWESAEFANHYKLDNLIAIVDYNHLQSLDFCNNTLEIEMARRWEGFGWHVIEIDGHNHAQIREALLTRATGSPTVVIANTVKGKSVSFMENNPIWHFRMPNEKELSILMEELGLTEAELA